MISLPHLTLRLDEACLSMANKTQPSVVPHSLSGLPARILVNAHIQYWQAQLAASLASHASSLQTAALTAILEKLSAASRAPPPTTAPASAPLLPLPPPPPQQPQPQQPQSPVPSAVPAVVPRAPPQAAGPPTQQRVLVPSTSLQPSPEPLRSAAAALLSWPVPLPARPDEPAATATAVLAAARPSQPSAAALARVEVAVTVPTRGVEPTAPVAAQTPLVAPGVQATSVAATAASTSGRAVHGASSLKPVSSGAVRTGGAPYPVQEASLPKRPLVALAGTALPLTSPVAAGPSMSAASTGMLVAAGPPPEVAKANRLLTPDAAATSPAAWSARSAAEQAVAALPRVPFMPAPRPPAPTPPASVVHVPPSLPEPPSPAPSANASENQLNQGRLAQALPGGAVAPTRSPSPDEAGPPPKRPRTSPISKTSDLPQPVSIDLTMLSSSDEADDDHAIAAVPAAVGKGVDVGIGAASTPRVPPVSTMDDDGDDEVWSAMEPIDRRQSPRPPRLPVTQRWIHRDELDDDALPPPAPFAGPSQTTASSGRAATAVSAAASAATAAALVPKDVHGSNVGGDGSSDNDSAAEQPLAALLKPTAAVVKAANASLTAAVPTPAPVRKVPVQVRKRGGPVGAKAMKAGLGQQTAGSRTWVNPRPDASAG